MKAKDFDILFDKMIKEESRIMKTKGEDYCGKDVDDRLANFKRASVNAGVTVEQAWYIYFCKHLDSLTSYIKHGKVESEPIESRISDLRNYLALLMGIIEDKKEGNKNA